MKRITGLLQEWGQFVSQNIDFSDEMGESILYRMAKFGGYTEQGDSGHKILCEDMPAKLRKIERAVKQLGGIQEKCIRLYFCAPLKEDGNPYEKRELALLLKTSKDKFDIHLQAGKKKLEYLLEI